MEVGLGEAVHAMYEEVKARGWGHKDFSVIYQLMLEKAQQAEAGQHGVHHPNVDTTPRR